MLHFETLFGIYPLEIAAYITFMVLIVLLICIEVSEGLNFKRLQLRKLLPKSESYHDNHYATTSQQEEDKFE